MMPEQQAANREEDGTGEDIKLIIQTLASVWCPVGCQEAVRKWRSRVALQAL